MKTIYMVEGTCGEYSDRSEWPVCAFTDEGKAKSLVEKLNELEKFNDEFHKRIHNEFEANYIDPVGLPPAPTYPDVPEGFHAYQEANSHGKGTPETKQKFKELQKLHQQNVDAYKEVSGAWGRLQSEAYERKQKAQDEWFKTNYIVPEHLTEAVPFIKYNGGYRSYYDSRYYYYEVTLYE